MSDSPTQSPDPAVEAARAEERARIVAWLRVVGHFGATDGQRVYLGAAAEIERGAHLEEPPTDPTVSAQLFAEGVGLPPVWRMVDPECEHWGLANCHIEPTDTIDLSGLQTAIGSAEKLDEWENRQDDTRWVIRLAFAVVGSPQWVEAVREMIARIERIGRNCAIRRALWPDVEVKPRTLTELMWNGNEWMLYTATHCQWFCADPLKPEVDPTCFTHVPALASVTVPDKAHKTIYEAVCGG